MRYLVRETKQYKKSLNGLINKLHPFHFCFSEKLNVTVQNQLSFISGIDILNDVMVHQRLS